MTFLSNRTLRPHPCSQSSWDPLSSGKGGVTMSRHYVAGNDLFTASSLIDELVCKWLKYNVMINTQQDDGPLLHQTVTGVIFIIISIFDWSALCFNVDFLCKNRTFWLGLQPSINNINKPDNHLLLIPHDIMLSELLLCIMMGVCVYLCE